MKKIFQLILLCVLLSFGARAQTPEKQKFHFGLKASPSLAWLKPDTKGFNSDGSKLGFAYGLITEFNFGDHYAFATGLDITYRGGRLKFTNDPATTPDTISVYSNKYNIQYLEIPLTLKLKTNEIGYLMYYLQAGISPGICIRAKGTQKQERQVNNGGTVTNLTTIEDDQFDFKDQINNFNVSMVIGGGVEYTLSGTTVLLLGLTFSNGFLDAFDKVPEMNNTNPKINSNYLALTIGVLF